MLKFKFFKHSTWLLVLIIPITSSCDLFSCGCTDQAGVHYDMKVVDEQGRNLLDTTMENPIIPEDIRLYRLEEGLEVLVRQEGGIDIPSRHGVIRAELGDGDGIRLFWGYEGSDDKFTGIIQWATGERDTLEHEFNTSGKNKHLIRILRKDEVLWDTDKDPMMLFTFIK